MPKLTNTLYGENRPLFLNDWVEHQMQQIDMMLGGIKAIVSGDFQGMELSMVTMLLNNSWDAFNDYLNELFKFDEIGGCKTLRDAHQAVVTAMTTGADIQTPLDMFEQTLLATLHELKTDNKVQAEAKAGETKQDPVNASAAAATQAPVEAKTATSNLTLALFTEEGIRIARAAGYREGHALGVKDQDEKDSARKIYLTTTLTGEAGRRIFNVWCFQQDQQLAKIIKEFMTSLSAAKNSGGRDEAAKQRCHAGFNEINIIMKELFNYEEVRTSPGILDAHNSLLKVYHEGGIFSQAFNSQLESFTLGIGIMFKEMPSPAEFIKLKKIQSTVPVEAKQISLASNAGSAAAVPVEAPANPAQVQPSAAVPAALESASQLARLGGPVEEAKLMPPVQALSEEKGFKPFPAGYNAKFTVVEMLKAKADGFAEGKAKGNEEQMVKHGGLIQLVRYQRPSL